MRVSYNTFARSCRANAYVCLRLSSTTFFKTFALSLSASTRRTAAFRHARTSSSPSESTPSKNKSARSKVSLKKIRRWRVASSARPASTAGSTSSRKGSKRAPKTAGPRAGSGGAKRGRPRKARLVAQRAGAPHEGQDPRRVCLQRPPGPRAVLCRVRTCTCRVTQHACCTQNLHAHGNSSRELGRFDPHARPAEPERAQNSV